MKSATPVLPGLLFIGIMALTSGSVLAQQEFPNKPVRLVSSAPGGAEDFVSRLIAQGITGPLG